MIRRTITLISLFALVAMPAFAADYSHQKYFEHYEGTATCLECHEDEAYDFMKTSHWTWMPMQDVIGQGEIALGKKNTMNNFCVGISSNWARCTSCHAGFGWVDDTFYPARRVHREEMARLAEEASR